MLVIQEKQTIARDHSEKNENKISIPSRKTPAEIT